MLRVALSFFVAMAVMSPAHATSFYPYQEQQVADANGRYYAVVKWVKTVNPGGQSDAKFVVTIAERAEGSPPVRSDAAQPKEDDDKWRDDVIVDPAICVRDGDIVHGRTELDRAPANILVSGTGKGIVLIDTYGFNNLGKLKPQNGIMLYSLDGKLRNSVDRSAVHKLMDSNDFRYIDGCVGWYYAAWIDDKRDELVIAGNEPKNSGPARSLVSMELSSGDIKKASPEVVERTIRERNPNALPTALELAKVMNLTGTRKHWPQILNDQKLSLFQRLHAAVLLAHNGDRQGVELIRNAAVNKPAQGEEESQGYALENVQGVFGEDAAAVLCEHVRKNGYGHIRAWSAFCKMSPSQAVPELRKLLSNKVPGDSRIFALHCLALWEDDSKDAVPELIRVLEDELYIRDLGWTKFTTHESAAVVIGKIGPDAAKALPLLIRIAEKDAPNEWAKVKGKRPESRQGDNNEGIKYSDNKFIDAIWKIRKE